MVRQVFEVLLPHPEGLPAKEVLAAVAGSLKLTEFEESRYPSNPVIRRFEKIVRFSTIAPVKAGWLLKRKGRWSLTQEGRQAFEKHRFPEEFFLESVRLHRQWAGEAGKQQPTPALDPQDPASVGSCVEHLYPETALRSSALRFLGTAIDGAHRFGPDKWRATVRRRRIRLRVGAVAVCELVAGQI